MRVENRRTDERGWLNCQTQRLITDDELASILRAAESGVVIGDPLSETEWITAERGSDVLGVAPQ